MPTRRVGRMARYYRCTAFHHRPAEGAGTGLGLSMIYGFAKQSGGQVRNYSEAGHGAMVCIYFPRVVSEGELARVAAELEAAPRATPGEAVLVVDDEELVRLLMIDVLEDFGYSSLEAGDAHTGLEILRSNARVDLLVTDVGLPGGMNGCQLAEAARTLRPDLKIFVHHRLRGKCRHR